LLVLPDQGEHPSLPLNVKYRLGSDIIQRAIRERATVEPNRPVHKGRAGKGGPVDPAYTLDDSTFADSLLLDRDLFQVIDFVAALAAVDGAVVLSRDLRLRGFGAEITQNRTPSREEQVEYDDHPEPLGKPAPAPLADFGMRHRSAVRFCQEVPGAMAFVVSQDGGIRMFHNVAGRVRQWVELSAEEW
jgi:hypothetical protein